MADPSANTPEEERNWLSQPTHFILKSKTLAPSRSPISGWISEERCPPGDHVLGEDCFYSQGLVLAGKWLFKAQWLFKMQWSCFTVCSLFFSLIFQTWAAGAMGWFWELSDMYGRLSKAGPELWLHVERSRHGWCRLRRASWSAGLFTGGSLSVELELLGKGESCGEGLCMVTWQSRNLTTIWTLGRFFTYLWGNAATSSEIAWHLCWQGWTAKSNKNGWGVLKDSRRKHASYSEELWESQVNTEHWASWGQKLSWHCHMRNDELCRVLHFPISISSISWWFSLVRALCIWEQCNARNSAAVKQNKPNKTQALCE